MKVLLITPTFFPDVGGVETMLLRFCDYLVKKRIYTEVITFNPLFTVKSTPIREISNKYLTIIRIPWLGYGLFNVFEKYPIIQFFYLVPALTLTTLFYLMFNKSRPRIIHAFGLSAAFAGGIVSRILKIANITDLCTVYRLPQRPILALFVKRILGWSNYIRANNPKGKEELIKIGLNAQKIGIISPPVDESLFRPMSKIKVRKKLGLTQNKFIALFVGRMVESKNVDLAVKITSLIHDRNIIFIFIGEGPLQYMVEKIAKKDKRVKYMSNVRYEDLVYYYNTADILLCAAVDEKLLSFVGREALMCGLPILAPNVGNYFGISYKINKNLVPSRVGKLIHPQPKEFARYLEKLIIYKKRNNKIPFSKDDCRKHALENYSSSALNWIGDIYKTIESNKF
ncbi:MAG: group 1 glycosyl transferase [Candidatus Gottesmanbacteria bacterium GW2011_GWA2_43_14]|uniref:Group 1 glycosyl transferase n=1 Tax=Candidatus Gottesmanbacteria bacterium GW2011_GWA2_43_14 TaxID=1618443 RepID=A0A0G1FM36_9BACT|nr:MAG: group 1 glycosyl transferase [Candidatus Gottesmanbacteria bacterium GW2011_GWA2_43_14]